MKVLLNGCSFMDNYHYREQFAELLVADVVNIAKPGSCNRRIIRTTVEHVEQNHTDLVILGLTFYDRQESPFANKLDPWVSYNAQGIQAVFSNIADYQSIEEFAQLNRYVDARYRYDINQHYLDSLYLDLRMLAGYLTYKNIKYCIFNTCDRHHKPVDLGTGFIPFNFIGNEFLEQKGAEYFEQDSELPQNARHHYGKDVIILTQYLVDYINDRPTQV